jgi:hypothetical protein
VSTPKRSLRSLGASLLLLFFFVAASSPASAADHPMHVRLEGGTDFPLDVAVRIGSEMPGRLRFSVSLGYLPSLYVDAMNGLLVNSFRAYDDKTAALIKSTLNQSAVLRLHTGWRPFRDLGWYFDAGYGVVALGGGTSAADVIATFVHRPLPPIPGADEKTFELKSVLHMLDVEIGWESLIGEYLSVRIALGGAFTVGSTSQIRAQFDPTPYAAAVAHYEDDAAGRLDHILRNYVFTPVVSFSMGYKLF